MLAIVPRTFRTRVSRKGEALISRKGREGEILITFSRCICNETRHGRAGFALSKPAAFILNRGRLPAPCPAKMTRRFNFIVAKRRASAPRALRELLLERKGESAIFFISDSTSSYDNRQKCSAFPVRRDCAHLITNESRMSDPRSKLIDTRKGGSSILAARRTEPCRVCRPLWEILKINRYYQ